MRIYSSEHLFCAEGKCVDIEINDCGRTFSDIRNKIECDERKRAVSGETK